MITHRDRNGVCDYILWSIMSVTGKKFQEGLLFRQIRPFGFGRNSQGLSWTRRAAKRREGEEMKFVFLLLLSRPSWTFFPEATHENSSHTADASSRALPGCFAAAQS